MQKEEKNKKLSINHELSEVWQELLGRFPSETAAQITPDEMRIPLLESDPWSALLKAKGTEAIDLQKLHLHMSDQDVEQILQVMQEQPGQGSENEGQYL